MAYGGCGRRAEASSGGYRFTRSIDCGTRLRWWDMVTTDHATLLTWIEHFSITSSSMVIDSADYEGGAKAGLELSISHVELWCFLFAPG